MLTWAQQQRLVKRLLDLSLKEARKAQGYYNAWQELGRMEDLLNANAHATNAAELLTGFYWYGESPPHKKRILQQWDKVEKLRSVVRLALLEQIRL